MQPCGERPFTILLMLTMLGMTALIAGPALGRAITPNWDRVVPPADEGENVAVYFSNGDNEILFTSAAIDSPEVIDEMLEVIQNAYGVGRVYWRAPQIEQILDCGVIRDGAAWHGMWAPWMDYLFQELGTGDHMIRAARQRGMEIWGVAALFDHGAQASIDSSKGNGPFFTENHIRLNHPEFIPIDRAGLRRMPGPISFAYPEARQMLVDMYVGLVRDKGYNGLTFQLYVENMGTRFDDEFGFNDPIVEAFQQRHGVDIRNESFDKQALAELRGEFLTQFFRELRQAMKPLGVKIGVTLGAKYPDLPQRWLAIDEVMVSGRIHVDWRTYVEEDLVDELFVYVHGSPMPTLRNILNELGPGRVSFATLNSAGIPETYSDLREAGVWRTIAGNWELLEFGYHATQPVEAMEGDDLVARLAVLSQMGAGETELDMDRVVAALEDESVLVRRRALRLLVTVHEQEPERITQEVLGRVIALLDDPQNIVRCTAVNTLGYLGGSDEMPALFDAIGRHANPMMHLLAAPPPLAGLPEERTQDLIRGMEHDSSDVRIVAMRAVSGGRARPEAWPSLMANADHPAWRVRWNVARSLERIHTPEAVACLIRMLDDEHATVRSMTARNLSRQLNTETRWIGGDHFKVIDKLAAMFARYGDGSEEVDVEWGWRPIGEALIRMGPRGREQLEAYLHQDEDQQLADVAWRALYVKQDSFRPMIITPEEAEEGYRMHPSRRSASASTFEVPDEPRWMPYIVQAFDTEEAAAVKDRSFGSASHHRGGWRDVDLDEAPSAIGGRSLHLTRTGDAAQVAQAFRRDYRVAEGQLRLRFSVRMDEPDAAMTAWLTSSGQWRGNLRVQVGPEGRLTLFNAEGRSVSVDHTLTLGEWHRLELAADLDANTMSLAMLSEGDHRVLVDEALLADGGEFNMMVLMPGGEPGTSTFIDDVEYVVTNPAFGR